MASKVQKRQEPLVIIRILSLRPSTAPAEIIREMLGAEKVVVMDLEGRS